MKVLCKFSPALQSSAPPAISHIPVVLPFPPSPLPGRRAIWCIPVLTPAASPLPSSIPAVSPTPSLPCLPLPVVSVEVIASVIAPPPPFPSTPPSSASPAWLPIPLPPPPVSSWLPSKVSLHPPFLAASSSIRPTFLSLPLLLQVSRSPPSPLSSSPLVWMLLSFPTSFRLAFVSLWLIWLFALFLGLRWGCFVTLPLSSSFFFPCHDL